MGYGTVQAQTYPRVSAMIGAGSGVRFRHSLPEDLDTLMADFIDDPAARARRRGLCDFALQVTRKTIEQVKKAFA